MAHVYVQPTHAPNGQWYNLYTPTPADFITLDTYLTPLLNGDGGGTWGPGAPIIINGAGMFTLGPWTLSGTAQALSSVSKPFTLGDNDFFALAGGHSGATRTIMQQCASALQTLIRATQPNPYEIPITWALTSGGESVYTFNIGGTNLVVPLSLLIPMRVHNGATIASATLTWAVGQSHAGVPENLPKWRLVSISPTGVIKPLNTTFTGSYDQQGYLLMSPPTDGTAYYNSGANYTPVYTCDAGVIADTSKEEYAIEITDEWGPANSLLGNLYYNVVVTFNSIPDMGFQT